MNNYYILDGKIAKRCGSFADWADWMENSSRGVAYDEIDEIIISTVFLGLNYNHWGQGDPLLFETMTFLPNDLSGLEQRRYFTWEEAEAGHREMVEMVKKQKLEADLRAAAALTNLQLVSGNQSES